MRICSLLPSATEIVAELGLAGSLVGISEECDWPPEVRDLPVVTASRVETTRLSSLEIDKAVRACVADAPTRSVFVAEWLEPPYAAGHWIPEMVEIAGGRDVLGHAGAPSYPTSWETVREAQPELVVVAPCGFDHTRAAREATLPPLACRAVAVDSNAYYARPAPRLADGIAQLGFLIHPDLVDDPGLPYVELATPTSPAPAILGDVAR